MKNRQTIELGDSEIVLIRLVKGLKSNKEIVEQMLELEKPDVVTLPLSPEGLEDMRAWDGNVQDIPLSAEDIMYLRGLERFGGGDLPPPEHTFALERAGELGIPVEAMDMDEDQFSKLFVDNVSIFELRRRSKLPKKLVKHEIIAETPEEYALAWETLLSDNRGLMVVEKAREKLSLIHI